MDIGIQLFGRIHKITDVIEEAYGEEIYAWPFSWTYLKLNIRTLHKYKNFSRYTRNYFSVREIKAELLQVSTLEPIIYLWAI